MKKQLKAPKGGTSGNGAKDPQVEEFVRRDLGDDLRASGMARVVRPRGRPTSILLDDELVGKLREKGAKRGLGYQTMLKLIVREHIGKY
jgi:predicted DNA binding CopG/RHH family protein